jgi:hypothetical protein
MPMQPSDCAEQGISEAVLAVRPKPALLARFHASTEITSKTFRRCLQSAIPAQILTQAESHNKERWGLSAGAHFVVRKES